MIDIFTYHDYRAYLRDYFDFRKKEDPKFSHRFLSQRLGLSTPNLMLLVMQGKRNLTLPVLVKLSQVLKHSRTEADYFEALVNFNQSKTTAAKQKFFSTMITFRKKNAPGTIEDWQYEYYSHWYNPVILELVVLPGYGDDYAKIARTVLPPITASQAKKAIELLISLKMIEKTDGRFVKRHATFKTPSEVTSVLIAGYHQQGSELAKGAYERTTQQERNITSCTLDISQAALDRIKEELTTLRQKIMEICESDPVKDRIYQLNLQLFPVTRQLTEGK